MGFCSSSPSSSSSLSISSPHQGWVLAREGHVTAPLAAPPMLGSQKEGTTSHKEGLSVAGSTWQVLECRFWAAHPDGSLALSARPAFCSSSADLAGTRGQVGCCAHPSPQTGLFCMGSHPPPSCSGDLAHSAEPLVVPLPWKLKEGSSLRFCTRLFCVHALEEEAAREKRRGDRGRCPVPLQQRRATLDPLP